MKSYYYVCLALALTCANAEMVMSPLPEQVPPFVNVPVPAHRTLTIRYYNPSRFSFIDCAGNSNNELTASWYYKGEKQIETNINYILLDTYNANAHGKLHLYNNTDHELTITCQPKFEPPVK